MGQEITSNTDKQLFVNSDRANLIVWNPRTAKAELHNESGDEKTYTPGTVLGRKTSGSEAGKLVPYDSTDSEGANVAVGILLSNPTIADGEEVEVTYYIKGDVNGSLLTFDNSSDDLDTIAGGEMVRDTLNANGLIIVPATELTEFDNS